MKYLFFLPFILAAYVSNSQKREFVSDRSTAFIYFANAPEKRIAIPLKTAKWFTYTTIDIVPADSSEGVEECYVGLKEGFSFWHSARKGDSWVGTGALNINNRTVNATSTMNAYEVEEGLNRVDLKVNVEKKHLEKHCRNKLGDAVLVFELYFRSR